MLNRKGQSIMLDLIFAITVFTIISTFLLDSYDRDLMGITKGQTMDELQQKAFTATEALVKTKGLPENWNEISLNSVEQFGLLARQGQLSESKVNYFMGLIDCNTEINSNYSKSKEIMNLGLFDYFFNLHNVTNDLNAGCNPSVDADIVAARRVVNYNGSEAIVTFKVYKIR
ncbi:MAG: hypothetical protein AB1467_04550 [Candidatus Diapherotrites archaeon]